jgi:demethylmenaquinone methyltransferase/2-methoxy-6-polyprenyl-1,4-benzoquinol methylase
MENNNNQVDFGFKKVALEEKTNLVKQVFSNVASKYDLMNDLMSLGLHRAWKSQMIKEINFSKQDNQADISYNLIDVASGTGDISFKILRKSKAEAVNCKIDLVDINQDMLEIGKQRAIDHNLFSDLNFTTADGENLPFKDQQFDFYTIAFGIRNFTNIDKGLSEAYRVLKTGGKFICLEFSQVNDYFLQKIYDLYSFKLIPKIGEVILKDKESYQYLVESIRRFPRATEFENMIKQAGFKNTSYKKLNFGVVAIHIGYKI